MSEAHTHRIDLSRNEDLERFVAVWNPLYAAHEQTVAELRHELDGGAAWIAVHRGRDVGVLGLGIDSVSSGGSAWVFCAAEPAECRSLVGAFDEAAAFALDHGRDVLECFSTISRPEHGIISSAGFVEQERFLRWDRRVRETDLPPTLPDRTSFETLASRPDLAHQLFDLVAVYVDEATPGARMNSFEAWWEALTANPTYRADGKHLLVGPGDEIRAYVSLDFFEAHPHRLWHGLSVTDPRFRRRGFATLLKRSTLAWAHEHGFTELLSQTRIPNAAMERLHDGLGYERVAERAAMKWVLRSTTTTT